MTIKMSEVFELPVRHDGKSILREADGCYLFPLCKADGKATEIAINAYDANQAEIADQKRKLDDKVKLIKFTDKANGEMAQEIAALKEQITNLTLGKSGSDMDVFKMSKLHSDKVDEVAALKETNENKAVRTLGRISRIERQEEENNELKAQVELYRRELVNSSETFTMLDDWTHPEVECDAPAAAIDELLDKTPKACAAIVKADAINSFIKSYTNVKAMDGHGDEAEDVSNYADVYNKSRKPVDETQIS